MISLDILDVNDVVYLANKIPVKDFVRYCQKHVKAFNAIKPGFRPKSLTCVQIQELFKSEFHKKKGLICDFLLMFIDRIIGQIREDFANQSDNNDEEIAWIAVSSTCYFSDNIALLDRLLDNSLEKLGSIRLMQAAINLIQESKKEFEMASDDAAEKIDKINEDVKNLQKEVLNEQQKTKELQDENKSLLEKLSFIKNENDTLKCETEKIVQSNVELQMQIEAVNDNMRTVSAENELLIAAKKDLEQKLADATDELTKARSHFVSDEICDLSSYIVPSEPLRPENFSVFNDYESDILEQIGIMEGRKLLVTHLNNIFFSGQPIVSSRRSAEILIAVLSNIYKVPITHIIYSNDITLAKIVYEIFSAKRIIYLDNFLGHFPETYLIPFLGSWKDKIIIMSATYDMTFKYISGDFLSYVSYVNFDKYDIKSDFVVQPIDEIISEIHFTEGRVHDKVEQLKLKKIMGELGFPNSVISKKVGSVYNSEDAQGILLFEILPYVLYVLKADPFSKSRSLELYCNSNANKTIIKWFGK